MKIINEQEFLICRRNELSPNNPEIRETGLKGLLKYRLLKEAKHPDSIYEGYNEVDGYYGKSKTAEYYEKIYKIDPFSYSFGSSDVIFNCWSFTKRFLSGVAKYTVDEKEALENYEKWIIGYESIKIKLDKLADYHHCLANFMPAPKRFNGTKYYDGKGNYERDNDFPDIYYKRIKNDDNLKYFHKWINNKMKLLSLEFFISFNSFLEDRNADTPVDIQNEEDIKKFEESLDNAIRCIEIRAMQLFKKVKN